MYFVTHPCHSFTSLFCFHFHISIISLVNIFLKLGQFRGVDTKVHYLEGDVSRALVVVMYNAIAYLHA